VAAQLRRWAVWWEGVVGVSTAGGAGASHTRPPALACYVHGWWEGVVGVSTAGGAGASHTRPPALACYVHGWWEGVVGVSTAGGAGASHTRLPALACYVHGWWEGVVGVSTAGGAGASHTRPPALACSVQEPSRRSHGHVHVPPPRSARPAGLTYLRTPDSTTPVGRCKGVSGRSVHRPRRGRHELAERRAEIFLVAAKRWLGAR
jgi:hypothetical protein